MSDATHLTVVANGHPAKREHDIQLLTPRFE